MSSGLPSVARMRGINLIQGAMLSEDRRYRYALWRPVYPSPEVIKPPAPAIMFVGLNPSTADENTNDPTIRRCMGFAKRWGYGWLIMVNLYAWRSTDPNGLKTCAEPRGEWASPMGIDRNRHVIRSLAPEVDAVIAAWGANPGPIAMRQRTIYGDLIATGKQVQALGFTAKGAPRHPLYMKADSAPVPLDVTRL